MAHFIFTPPLYHPAILPVQIRRNNIFILFQRYFESIDPLELLKYMLALFREIN